MVLHGVFLTFSQHYVKNTVLQFRTNQNEKKLFKIHFSKSQFKNYLTFCFCRKKIFKNPVSALKKHKNFNLVPHDDECDPWNPSPRILGGGDTFLGEFPWLVVLFLNRKCALELYDIKYWSEQLMFVFIIVLVNVTP